MIDPAAVLNNLVAQAPLLAIALVALYYSLDRKIEKLDARIERLGREISELRRELRTFADAVVGFQETLIEFLEVKGMRRGLRGVCVGDSSWRRSLSRLR